MLIFNLSNISLNVHLKNGRLIDLSGINGTSCYCDEAAKAQIRAKIEAEISFGKPSSEPQINLIDCGDYHYMTALLCEPIKEPFSLVLFDHHPDMQSPAFGNVLSCGGWVRTMLEEHPYLKKVLIIGINPELLCETDGFPGIVTVIDRNATKAEALSAIRDWKLEGKLYISIDKDVLSKEFASTDWDQGNMTLDTLLSLVKACISLPHKRLIGVDLCGGVPQTKGGTPKDASLNAIADKAIIDLINNQY